MNITIRLLLIGLTLLGVACQKNGPKDYVRDIPDSFVFAVLDNKGQPLLTAPDQKVVLSFRQNGQRKEITEYQLMAIPAGYPPGGYIYSSRDPAFFSAGNGIREFYLELNSRVDTVYLEVEMYASLNRKPVWSRERRTFT
ncbi:hypothetical protein, partial [uncultured Hymenobacter sp.]|uniref:hypothetical protein n=1 Tax=uncultured Hymenobacter sp. TaxID=170016 RepID=UPI0035C97107